MIFHTDVVYYDLVSRLRSDPKLLDVVGGLVDASDKIAIGIRAGKGKPFTHDNYAKIGAAVVQLCGNNFGGLLSGFLPDFRRNQPFSIVERPYMAVASTLSPGMVVLKAGRQVGKCATGDTELVTETGKMTMRELFDTGVSQECGAV